MPGEHYFQYINVARDTEVDKLHPHIDDTDNSGEVGYACRKSELSGYTDCYNKLDEMWVEYITRKVGSAESSTRRADSHWAEEEEEEEEEEAEGSARGGASDIRQALKNAQINIGRSDVTLKRQFRMEKFACTPSWVKTNYTAHVETMQEKQKIFRGMPGGLSVSSAQSKVPGEIDQQIPFMQHLGEYMGHYARWTKDRDDEECLAALDVLEADLCHNKQFFWNGESHRPCDFIPPYVCKDVGSMRAGKLVPQRKYKDIMPTIMAVVKNQSQEDREQVSVDLLEEIAVNVCAAGSGAELIEICRSLCACVLDGPVVLVQTHKKARVLKETPTDGSSDVDLSFLSNLALVPATAKQAQDEINAEIPEKIKARLLRPLADNIFYRNCPIHRLKAAHRVYSDPKAERFLRNIFGGNAFAEIYEEAESWVAESEKLNQRWLESVRDVSILPIKQNELKDLLKVVKPTPGGISLSDAMPKCHGFLGDVDMSRSNTICNLGQALLSATNGRMAEQHEKDVKMLVVDNTQLVRRVQELCTTYMTTCLSLHDVKDGAEQGFPFS